MLRQARTRLREAALEDPIERPSSRLPHGVVTYASDNKALALAACRETERLTGANGGATAVCYPPDTKRPFQGKAQRFESGQVFAGFMVLLLAVLTSVFVGHLIVRYDAFTQIGATTPLRRVPRNFIRRLPRASAAWG